MKKLKIAALILVIIAGLSYAGLACYYSSLFNKLSTGEDKRCYMCGTVINNTYATGFTPEEMNKKLTDNYQLSPISFKTENESFTVNPEDIDYKVDYLASLEQILENQNPVLWIKYALQNNVHDIKPVITVDKDKLNAVFDQYVIYPKNTDYIKVYISLTEEGYQLIDNSEDKVDLDKMKEDLYNAVISGQLEFYANDSYYTEYIYSERETELMDFYQKLADVQDRSVTYYFGSESKKLTPYDWDTLISKSDTLTENFYTASDAKSAFEFDIPKEKAVEFIDGFLDEYNTYNNRYFTTHSKEVVYVTKGNYGNKLNVEKEEEWFSSFVSSSDKRATRVPEYLIEAKYREKNDFGDTFIEISIDEQHLWYYVDGEVYVDTPITSGSLAHGGTAPRVVYVYTKIPNKWLTGPTWHNFVKYWVAIQGSIGIHDSSWRKEYGNQSYKWNGSHGCINTPEEAMKKIFDKVEIGTPVIVYSLEKNGVKNEE